MGSALLADNRARGGRALPGLPRQPSGDGAFLILTVWLARILLNASSLMATVSQGLILGFLLSTHPNFSLKPRASVPEPYLLVWGSLEFVDVCFQIPPLCWCCSPPTSWAPALPCNGVGCRRVCCNLVLSQPESFVPNTRGVLLCNVTFWLFLVTSKCLLMKAEMANTKSGRREKPKDALQDTDGLYDPECENNGLFKAKQCNGTTCWCVNTAGVRRTDKHDTDLKCNQLVRTT